METSDAGGDRNEQQRPQVPSAETSSNNVQQVSRGGGEGGGDGVVSSNSYISSNKLGFVVMLLFIIPLRCGGEMTRSFFR